jgi:hypothetical protein
LLLKLWSSFINVLATLAHPNHLDHLSSWGWSV